MEEEAEKIQRRANSHYHYSYFGQNLQKTQGDYPIDHLFSELSLSSN